MELHPDKDHGKRKGAAWEFFVVKDENKKIATCTLCSEAYSFNFVSNLYKHLSRMHSLKLKLQLSDNETNEDEESDRDSETVKSGKNDECVTPGPRKLTSMSWEYFKITDKHSKLAQCKLCSHVLTYRSGVSNLMKHVKRKHMLQTSKTDDETDVDVTHKEAHEMVYRSAVWAYFERVDPEARVALCLLCKKSLSYSSCIGNLRKHLKRQHPLVSLTGLKENDTIILSTGDQLFEVETNPKLEADDVGSDAEQNALDIDDVYIEEYNESATEKAETKGIQINRYQNRIRQKRKENTRTYDRHFKKKRFTTHLSESSSEEMTVKKNM